MVAIQLRRGSAIPAGESHLVGEPLWDPANSRFGIFNNRAPTAVEWYPRVIGDEMQLNANQFLTGRTAGDADNDIKLDWSVAGELRVVHIPTSTVIARFTQSTSYFNAVSGSAPPELGMINRALNGNISVIRRQHPITTVNTSNATYRSYLVAPNWHLWRQAGAAGDMSLTFSDTVPFLGCPRSFMLGSFNNLSSGGLRTFLMDYDSLAGRDVNLSWYLYGVAGQTTSWRVIDSSNTVLDSGTYLSTGAWDRIDSAIVPTTDARDWIAVDVLYNPSANSASNQTWLAAAFQASYGTALQPYENRPATLERALLHGLFQEGQVYLSNNAVKANIDLQQMRTVPIIQATEPGSSLITIESPSESGALVYGTNLTGPATVKYTASAYPTTVETA